MPVTTYHEPARTAVRGTQSAVRTAAVIVGAVLLGVLGYESLTASSSSAAAPVGTFRDGRAPDLASPSGTAVADGAVPRGVTVFETDFPAVANLDRALLRALRQAAMNAASEGVESYVNSGWRSPSYQERLFQQAVAKYGSEREAARWVSTPARSAHVSGDAVDIGPSDATAWLSEHGAAYGLCQIYRNEPWHFELRPRAVGHGCPPRYDDPTQDPRMKR